jgi:hypothetical protein
VTVVSVFYFILIVVVDYNVVVVDVVFQVLTARLAAVH